MQPDNRPAVLFGRFMLPDTSEHACQIADIDLDGASFQTSAVGQPGDVIVAYIDELGRIEGKISGAIPGGFYVKFELTGSRLERFDARLKWLSSKNRTGAEQRRHPRFEPRDNKSHITLPDGRVYPCEVLDISLSGAAVKTDVMPSLGTYVLLGKMRGRVVRFHDSGIAIEFVRPMDSVSLAQQVV